MVSAFFVQNFAVKMQLFKLVCDIINVGKNLWVLGGMLYET